MMSKRYGRWLSQEVRNVFDADVSPVLVRLGHEIHSKHDDWWCECGLRLENCDYLRAVGNALRLAWLDSNDAQGHALPPDLVRHLADRLKEQRSIRIDVALR